MADDKERDSTNGSTPASAEPTGDDLVAAASDNSRIELGAESDQSETFEPDPHPERVDEDAEDPDAGDGDDVPDELRGDGDPVPRGDVDELVTVGAPAGAAGGEPRKGSAAISPRPKSVPTPRRDGPVEKPSRTGPVKFVKESVGELRKVVYPTGQQLVQYFVVVLIFVLFIIAIVSLLDLGFGWAIFQIFS